MKSDWFNDVLRAFTSGSVRQNLTFSLLGDLKIPLPSLEEQKKIIALWHKAQSESKAYTEQAETLKKEIDDYLMSELGITVQKQEKSKVFTTRYKDLERWDASYYNTYSDISFLKNIHVDSILNYVTVISGVTFSKQQESEAGSIILRANNIDLHTNSLNLDKKELKYINENVRLSNEKQLHDGDIFICTNSGSKSHIGKVAYIEKLSQPMFFGSFMGVLRVTNTQILSKYLFYYMCSSIYKLNIQNILANTTTINNLSSEKMKNIKIPLPPLEKQQEIVEHITKLKTQISNLQTKAQDTISSTRETIKNQIIK